MREMRGVPYLMDDDDDDHDDDDDDDDVDDDDDDDDDDDVVDDDDDDDDDVDVDAAGLAKKPFHDDLPFVSRDAGST